MQLLLIRQRQRTAAAPFWAAVLVATIVIGAITGGHTFPGVFAAETTTTSPSQAAHDNNSDEYRLQQQHQQRLRREIHSSPPGEPPFIKNRHPEAAYQPSLAEIDAARKSSTSGAAAARSLVSHVKGHAFDRIVQIWLENQDFEKCEKDPNLQYLATRGILLTNYHAVTHPSQPNYAASVSGDTFGMDHDRFISFPSNISTVVDLLETRHITWAEYQEHLPFPGFTGLNYSRELDLSWHSHSHSHSNSAAPHAQQLRRNAKEGRRWDLLEERARKGGGRASSTGARVPPDYVRKHNPLIMFDSVAKNESRVRNIKGLEAFYEDLENRTLPQWSFITPNMTNDAHDTNITFAAKWLRGFLDPLLENDYFMDRTLVVITFDESERYTIPNRVYTILLGGSIPPTLHGTQDSMYYSLYSLLSTVSLNWDLPSLGRWDCDANVFPPLSHILSYANTDISSLLLLPADSSSTLSSDERKKHHPHWNRSYPGPASLKRFTPGWWPVPNTVAKCVSGRGVLEKVRQTWGDHQRGSYNYTSVYPHHRSFDGLGNPVEAITTVVSRLVMTGADVEDADAAGGNKTTNGTETGPDTDTETVVYGDGPLKPIDGVMDRGFSSSHHNGNHHHHHSHNGSNGVDKEDDDGNDDGWNEEGNGQINGNTIRGTTKNKKVFHNGAAPGISLLRISSRIELVLLLQFWIAMGVAWIL